MSTSGSYTRPGRRVEAQTGVTNASGQVTFTWAPPFATPPVVTTSVAAGTGFYALRVTANSPTATTVEVTRSAAVTVLSIGVLAASVPASGATVTAIAAAGP